MSNIIWKSRNNGTEREYTINTLVEFAKSAPTDDLIKSLAFESVDQIKDVAYSELINRFSKSDIDTSFDLIKSAFNNDEIDADTYLDYKAKYELIKGDPSHNGKLVKKTILNKMGKKETVWVKRDGSDQEEETKPKEPVPHSKGILSAFAKEAPEKELKRSIAEHHDPKVRAAAHSELARRDKTEKPKEDKKETPKKKADSVTKKESKPEDHLTFKNDRLIVDGEDLGTLKFTKLNKNTLEIDKLYIDKAKQKGGLGRKVISKLFDDNDAVDKIVVYPLGTSEAFWGRFAEDMDSEGNFHITRKSYKEGIDKYFGK